MANKFSFVLITILLMLAGCSKDSSPTAPNTPTATLPVVSTNATVTIYNMTSASSGGTVLLDGGATITARGVCWATHSNPTIANEVYNSAVGAGTGSFSASMHNLTIGGTYFVKAFATNSKGTAYGDAVMFTVPPGAPGGGNVYATGYLNNGPVSIPTVWRNGVPNPLTTGLQPAETYSIFVDGLEVFAVGYERNGAVNMARVWKNGAGTFLTNSNGGGGVARSLITSDTDVYVAGESMGPANKMATLWKNGTASFLSAGTSPAGANAVIKYLNDVYVAGFEGNVAKFWKNGVPTSLTNGAGPAVAHWVTAFFPNVYMVGSEMMGANSAAVIWTNGVAAYLTNGSFNAAAYSVYIYGSATTTDVYVAGYESNGTKKVAKFWKNGVPTSLTDGTKNAEATSVYGSGTDIYIGGYEHDGTKNIAKLWKNGIEVFLQNSTNEGSIFGVFVK